MSLDDFIKIFCLVSTAVSFSIVIWIWFEIYKTKKKTEALNALREEIQKRIFRDIFSSTKKLHVVEDKDE